MAGRGRGMTNLPAWMTANGAGGPQPFSQPPPAQQPPSFPQQQPPPQQPPPLHLQSQPIRRRDKCFKQQIFQNMIPWRRETLRLEHVLLDTKTAASQQEDHLEHLLELQVRAKNTARRSARGFSEQLNDFGSQSAVRESRWHTFVNDLWRRPILAAQPWARCSRSFSTRSTASSWRW